MRNLKRALSLALATVMTLGLMVVGTGAVGYDDVADTDNVEAIEVLQAVGIMTGVTDTEFDPDGLVTRNQMAVIMSQLLNLDYDYYRGTNPFTDVPSWAAPYVAACAAEGVTAGIGDGLYGGDQNVTAAQAALMILKTLGYFQYQADFDSDWQISTVRQASYIGLFDGIDASAEEALTRNQIAQLVLNGLQSDMVYFTGDVGITVNGVVIGHKSEYTDRTSSDSKYNAMIDDTNDIAGTDRYIVQLGEELYDGNLRLRASTDDFGRPATTWRYDGRDIGTYTDDADLVYTTGVSPEEIYNDLGLSQSISSNNVTAYVDGVEQTNTQAIRRGLDTDLADSGNGVLTQVWYDDDDNTALITHVNTYVGTVVRSVEEDGDDPAYVIVSPEEEHPTGMSSNAEFETDDQFDDDAYVLYTYSEYAREIKSVEPAEELNGVVTRAENANSNETDKRALTIDGERYTQSKKASGENLGDISVNEEYTVYLDSYGYLIFVERIDEIGDYALLYRTSSGNWNTANQAFLIFADGTKARVDTAKNYADAENLNYDVNGDGKVDGTDTAAWDGVDVAGDPVIVTYRVDDNNVYTLRAVSSTQNGTPASWNVTVQETGLEYFSLMNDKAGITIKTGDVVRANSATTFVVRDPASITDNSAALDTDPDWTSYTGIKNAPTIQSLDMDANPPAAPSNDADYNEDVNVYYYCKNSNMVTIMFIVPGSRVLVDDGNTSALFLAQDGVSNLIHDTDGSYYEYNAIVDNDITTVRVASDVTVDGAKQSNAQAKQLGDVIYERYSINDDGIITRLETYDDSYNTTPDEAGYGEYTGIDKTSEEYTVILEPDGDNHTVTVDTDANIYYVDEDGNISESSYRAIAIDNNDEIRVVVDDWMVQTLVIIEKPSPLSTYAVDVNDYNEAMGTVRVDGAVIDNDRVDYDRNDSAVITVTPKTGYEISKFEVNGVDELAALEEDGEYVINRVNQLYTVVVEFKAEDPDTMQVIVTFVDPTNSNAQVGNTVVANATRNGTVAELDTTKLTAPAGWYVDDAAILYVPWSSTSAGTQNVKVTNLNTEIGGDSATISNTYVPAGTFGDGNATITLENAVVNDRTLVNGTVEIDNGNSTIERDGYLQVAQLNVKTDASLTIDGGLVIAAMKLENGSAITVGGATYTITSTNAIEVTFNDAGAGQDGYGTFWNGNGNGIWGEFPLSGGVVAMLEALVAAGGATKA